MVYEIDVRELKRKCDAILDRIIIQLGVTRLRIDPKEDFYFDIPDDEMFDVSNRSPEIVNGRLSDDVDFLNKMESDESVPLMLDHVAPILRYLAYKIPGYPQPRDK